MTTDTIPTWPTQARPAEWSVWPDRPEALEHSGHADRLDGIVRLLDDGDANDMTLLRLVLAVAISLGVLGVVLHLVG